MRLGIGISEQNSGEAPVRLLPARVVELDSPRFRASPDDPSRTAAGARAVVRLAEWRRDDDARYGARPPRVCASLAFAAQSIAQEVLSEGLYFENFRPAVKAYAAADASVPGEVAPTRMELWV
jgi:hypothetical protein